MRLPSFEKAIISAEKLRDYVLSPAHPVGRFKAAFFERLGYDRDDWERLDRDLREQIVVCEAEEIETTTFGTKYRTVGDLRGPSGRAARIVAIWIVRVGESVPQLVTLFPGGAS